MKKNLLILGGSGMLGSRLVELLSDDFVIEFPTSQMLNLFDKRTLRKKVLENSYNAIIYSAGLTNQIVCEKEKEQAKYLNADVLKIITKEAKKNNTKVIYFSTDAVFGGERETGYKEEDKKNPVNYYGYTKSIGEELVLEESNDNLVIRIASLYTHKFSKKADFVRRSLDFLKKGEKSIGISDQFFNPSYTDSTVEVLKKALTKNVAGVFHLGTKDVISNFEFIKLVANKFEYNENLIEAVKFKDFFKESSVARGHHQILNVNRAVKLFGNLMTTNEKNIDEFKKKYNA